MVWKSSKSGGTKATSAKLARSVLDVGRARLEASVIFMTAFRAATMTCGGLLAGDIFDRMAESAPAACMGARKGKPPSYDLVSLTNNNNDRRIG